MLRVLLYAPYLIILFASLQVPFGPFQPAKAIFIGIDVLLSVRMQRITGTSSISSPTMSDIMVKIMVQVLNVLALATKQIKQGRFSKQSTACSSSSG